MRGPVSFEQDDVQSYWEAHSPGTPYRPRPPHPCVWHFGWQKRSPGEYRVFRTSISALTLPTVLSQADHPTYFKVTLDAAGVHCQLLPARSPGS